MMAAGRVVRGQEADLEIRARSSAGQITRPVRRTLHWIRTSETNLFYRHGGQKLDQGPTFNDFYGFLTSVPSALEDANLLCRRFKIGPPSTLELVAQLRLFDTPYQSVKPLGPGRKMEVVPCPDDWYWPDGQMAGHPVEQEKVGSPIEIWNSGQGWGERAVQEALSSDGLRQLAQVDPDYLPELIRLVDLMPKRMREESA